MGTRCAIRSAARRMGRNGLCEWPHRRFRRFGATHGAALSGTGQRYPKRDRRAAAGAINRILGGLRPRPKRLCADGRQDRRDEVPARPHCRLCATARADLEACARRAEPIIPAATPVQLPKPPGKLPVSFCLGTRPQSTWPSYTHMPTCLFCLPATKANRSQYSKRRASASRSYSAIFLHIANLACRAPAISKRAILPR